MLNRLLKNLLLLGFICLCFESYAESVSIRTLVIYSEKYLNSYPNKTKAKDEVKKEILFLNNSLEKQKVKIFFNLIAEESVTLDYMGSPEEYCYDFVGDSFYLIDPNPEFANLVKYRKKHKADVVILMTYNNSSHFIASKNYGIACDQFYDGSFRDYRETDQSYLIVDKQGLNTLTLPHEIGHFLGLDHHYALIDQNEATMMIGNGNEENLRRIGLWSDSSMKPFYEYGEVATSFQGLGDVQIMNHNAVHASQAFERMNNTLPKLEMD